MFAVCGGPSSHGKLIVAVAQSHNRPAGRGTLRRSAGTCVRIDSQAGSSKHPDRCGSLGARDVGIVEVRPSRFGDPIEERVQFAQYPEFTVRTQSEPTQRLFRRRFAQETCRISQSPSTEVSGGVATSFNAGDPSFDLYPGELPRFADDGEESLRRRSFWPKTDRGSPERRAVDRNAGNRRDGGADASRLHACPSHTTMNCDCRWRGPGLGETFCIPGVKSRGAEFADNKNQCAGTESTATRESTTPLRSMSSNASVPG